MTFASPLSLALLAPWAALALWLLWARHRATSVPFIDLWRGAVKLPRASRQFSPPPTSLIAMLSAVFLAILAAAGPSIRRANAPPPVTLVLDRGITMSAAGRISEVLALVKDLNPARRITIPDDPTGDAQPTCVDTAVALQETVANLLSHAAGPIVVLTDQPLRADPRVVAISPTRPVANVAITHFSIREHPTTQAMITLRNDSTLTHGNLSVDNIHQSIDLPPAGEERNYFIDLPSAPAKAQATLDVADDFDGDNAAYLARQRDLPHIEMRGSLAPEVHRVVEAYQSARSGSNEGATSAVVISQDQLKDDQPGVISPLAASRINSELIVQIHPITTNLDLPHWTNLQSTPPPTGDHWSPIITADNKPLLSIREHPARQVWIGFTSPDLPRTADFVILWTNALDWVAAGVADDTFAAAEMGQLSSDWKPLAGRLLWPGFFRRSDGPIRAANAPAARFAFSPSNQTPLTALAALISPQQPSGSLLAPYLSVAAIICASFALCLWPGRILTAFSAARTV